MIAGRQAKSLYFFVESLSDLNQRESNALAGYITGPSSSLTKCQKKRKRKKTRIQEYTWNTKTPDGSSFNFQTALHAVVISASWADACKYSFPSSGQIAWYTGIELQLVLSDFLFWFQWLLCLLSNYYLHHVAGCWPFLGGNKKESEQLGK